MQAAQERWLSIEELLFFQPGILPAAVPGASPHVRAILCWLRHTHTCADVLADAPSRLDAEEKKIMQLIRKR